MSAPLLQTDQQVLDAIRVQGPLSVTDLEEHLGVTATAVRQRLNRLVASGLVDRRAERNENSRGRPSHQYHLTEKGHEAIGDNLADFAKILWAEVQKIEDDEVRRTVLDGVVTRLSELYGGQIRGDSAETRLASIAKLFRDRQVPFSVETENDLPVLKINGCPYPELVDTRREICEVEQRLLSELATIPLSLDQCSCEGGGHCCTFQPTQQEAKE